MVPKEARMKMIIILAVLTPGIPEYLTGSWKLSVLVTDPFRFLLFLVINIALYTSGALLVREFTVKFNKGWASIIVLGMAYGIVEEGIALHTFVQASGSPVGFLSSYGRFAGIDWVWAFGLTFFHAVFSIGLPLLILAVSFPEHSREPLLGKGSIAIVGSFYFTAVLFLNFIINRTSTRAIPSAGEYLLFIAVSLFLILLAYMVPKDLISAKGTGRKSTLKLYLLGFVTFPAYNIFAFVPVNTDILLSITPVTDILIHTFIFLIIAIAIMHYTPPLRNRRHMLALSAGLVSPLFILALKLQLNGTAPLIMFIAITAVILLTKLGMDIRMHPDHVDSC